MDKWRNLAGGAALALLLSGCGGAVAAAPTVALAAAHARLRRRAHADPPAGRLPQGLPFPPGAVLTVGRDMGNGGRVVGGFASPGRDRYRPRLAG